MSASLQQPFPPHPGQGCSTASGKIWAVAVRRILPGDWLALLNGLQPRALLQYEPQSVPAALVFAAATQTDPGVPQSSVLTRDAEILRITDANAQKTSAKAAHDAELRHAFFVALELSLCDTAPLLLDQLRRDHVLGYSNAMHDGPAAFNVLWTRYHDASLMRAPGARA
jgi:hypothetical protein